MEFVNDLEYFSTLILIPIFSIMLFLIIAFLEIFDRHGEILFINKNHNYKNTIFIMPLILALLVGLFFYGFYFHGDFMKVTNAPPPQPCTEHAGNLTKLRLCRDEILDRSLFSFIDKWINLKHEP